MFRRFQAWCGYKCQLQLPRTDRDFRRDQCCSPCVQDGCRKGRQDGSDSCERPVPFPLMEPAARKLQADLERIQIRPPSVPVYTNVTGKTVSCPQEIKQTLVRQVTSPVLWQVAVENMIGDGSSLFIEVGPGKALSGFGRRIDPKIPFVKFGTPEDLDDVLDSHKEAWLE